MMTKSMFKNSQAEDMEQFLYHLDPNARKIRLEKLQLKIINKECSIIFNNKTCLNKQVKLATWVEDDWWLPFQ